MVDIICQQEAAARFIARHLYSFFVADEPPVPEWPYTDPQDPAAIDALTQAYFDSGGNITAMLRTLFNSNFFRDEATWYRKVKSPVELVAGVLRLTGEFDRPRREMLDRYQQAIFMGQFLNNPPSVEGWHQGTDWIDTGSLVERINFASQQLGDTAKPGVQAMVEKIASNPSAVSPDMLVDACLDQVGAITVSEATRRELVDFASVVGNSNGADHGRIAEVLQMVASTHEFQRA